MATYRYSLADLPERLVSGMVITYNTDSADELTLSVPAEDYTTRFTLQPWDRIEITEPVNDVDRLVFSGVVPADGGISESAGNGQDVTIRALSDWALLDLTVYAKMSGGNAMYTGSPETADLTSYARSIFDWATGWDGTLIASTLSVADGLGTIIAPASSGTTSCASLIEQALAWQPAVVATQRYSPLELTLAPVDASAPVIVAAQSAQLTSVRAQPRADLQPPVCALVGGAHLILPEGADIRQPGAFVCAVPQPSNGWLGAQKEIVKGLLIPTRSAYTPRHGKQLQPQAMDVTTRRFVQAFWPEYADLLQYLDADVCYISTVPAELLYSEDGTSPDPDALTPANYDTDLTSWSQLAPNVCVHTAGSFPASATRSKNVAGLKWCRAELHMNVSISASVETTLSKTERLQVHELLPGIIPRTPEGKGRQGRYAHLTLACNLINTKKKVFDASKNELLRGDSDYEPPTEANEPRLADYISAMTAYYNQTRQLWHEGTVELIHEGSLNPSELTGRCLRITGLAPEWETMNALVRSVTWDVSGQTIQINFGPRDILGYGEQLERLTAGRRTINFLQRRLAIGTDTLDEAAQLEREADMVVGPSVSAAQSVEVGGKWRRPFSLWRDEDGTLWLEGGRITRGNTTLDIPTTDSTIIAGSQSGTAWVEGSPVKARAYKKYGSLTFDVYQ